MANVLRTEWHRTTEQIRADVERMTGRRVARVWRGSGLYATVYFQDSPEQGVNFADGSRPR